MVADMDLAGGVVAGKKRAVARLISLIESDDPAAVEALAALPATEALVIGVTGSPGTGKSTLTDRLIAAYRRSGRRVGVIAVDPSSPFTGGAILGDRIRMQAHGTDPDVFIRSMGTRGALGGLSHHTGDAVRVLAAAGHDIVIVETVGVGQAEVDVVRLADTVLVVLVPNLGDDVQAVKAGLMEIADLFVINKADLDGADRVVGEVEGLLSLGHAEGDDPWIPPILRTIAERGQGVEELVEGIGKHHAWAQRTGALASRRERRRFDQVRALVARDAVRRYFDAQGNPRPHVAALFKDGAPPHAVAARLRE